MKEFPISGEQEQPHKIQNLSELLHEPKEDYSRVIAEASREELDEGELSASYSHTWDRFVSRHKIKDEDPRLVELFKKAISGNVLCELGGAGGRMEFLAANMDAGLYINVDKYPNGIKNDPKPVDPMVGVIKQRDFVVKMSGMKDVVLIEGIHDEIHVRADMLDFISRLKDASVNIVINGIDSEVIKVPEYHELLAKEILRVTKKNGVIFGNMSDSLFILKSMIKKSPELKDQFEIVEAKVGAGGAVVIHRK